MDKFQKGVYEFRVTEELHARMWWLTKNEEVAAGDEQNPMSFKNFNWSQRDLRDAQGNDRFCGISGIELPECFQTRIQRLILRPPAMLGAKTVDEKKLKWEEYVQTLTDVIVTEKTRQFGEIVMAGLPLPRLPESWPKVFDASTMPCVAWIVVPKGATKKRPAASQGDIA